MEWSVPSEIVISDGKSLEVVAVDVGCSDVIAAAGCSSDLNFLVDGAGKSSEAVVAATGGGSDIVPATLVGESLQVVPAALVGESLEVVPAALVGESLEVVPVALVGESVDVVPAALVGESVEGVPAALVGESVEVVPAALVVDGSSYAAGETSNSALVAGASLDVVAAAGGSSAIVPATVEGGSSEVVVQSKCKSSRKRASKSTSGRGRASMLLAPAKCFKCGVQFDNLIRLGAHLDEAKHWVEFTLPKKRNTKSNTSRKGYDNSGGTTVPDNEKKSKKDVVTAIHVGESLEVVPATRVGESLEVVPVALVGESVDVVPAALVGESVEVVPAALVGESVEVVPAALVVDGSSYAAGETSNSALVARASLDVVAAAGGSSAIVPATVEGGSSEVVVQSKCKTSRKPASKSTSSRGRASQLLTPAKCLKCGKTFMNLIRLGAHLDEAKHLIDLKIPKEQNSKYQTSRKGYDNSGGTTVPDNEKKSKKDVVTAIHVGESLEVVPATRVGESLEVVPVALVVDGSSYAAGETSNSALVAGASLDVVAAAGGSSAIVPATVEGGSSEVVVQSKCKSSRKRASKSTSGRGRASMLLAPAKCFKCGVQFDNLIRLGAHLDEAKHWVEFTLPKKRNTKSNTSREALDMSTRATVPVNVKKSEKSSKGLDNSVGVKVLVNDKTSKLSLKDLDTRVTTILPE